MKKIIYKLSILIIIACTILRVNDVSAQAKTTLEMLQNKVWVMQFPTPKYIGCYEQSYTANELIGVMLHENTTKYEKRSPYYLSNVRTSTFDEQKVGQVVKGKYIIVNSEARNLEKDSIYYRIIIYQILKLTDTDLELKNVADNVILSFKSK